MKYTEYLKTDWWKSISSAKKLNSRCGVCGSKNNLDTHHIKYMRKGESVLFKETPGILRVLCHDCHFLWHKVNPKVVYRGKHAGRIKFLISLGATKVYAFENCTKDNYKRAKKLLKPTGVEVVGVGTQISPLATLSCIQ